METQTFELTERADLKKEAEEVVAEANRIRAISEKETEDIQTRIDLMYEQKRAVENAQYEKRTRLWDAHKQASDYLGQVHNKEAFDKKVAELKEKYGEQDYKYSKNNEVVLIRENYDVIFGYSGFNLVNNTVNFHPWISDGMNLQQAEKLVKPIFDNSEAEKQKAIKEFLDTRHETEINRKERADGIIIQSKDSNGSWNTVYYLKIIGKLESDKADLFVKVEDSKGYESLKRAENKFIEWSS